jgi:hypothetical protein
VAEADGAALLLLGVVGRPQSATARLDPSTRPLSSYGQTAPRILFMLDRGLDINT